MFLTPDAAQAADLPKEIRIGVAGVGTGNRPVVGGAYVATAANNGDLENEFKKDGIAVKYVYFAGAGPAVNEALANGQLDFAYQGDLPALVAKAGGLPTKLILAAGRFLCHLRRRSRGFAVSHPGRPEGQSGWRCSRARIFSWPSTMS
jgi:ABC-type nitrate/sulfonate/bicarbonate transport system substrate-binding protein